MSLTHDPTATSSSPPADPRPTRDRSGRLLLRRLHFYAGILVAPFLLIAAVSGALYAVAPTMENIVYRGYLHTESTGTPQPLADQVSAALDARPDLELSAVRPSTQPGDTTRVLFDDPTLGKSERLAVFVDPVTAQPVGELVAYGSSGALPLRTWISQLHRHLHLGEPGRIYSELAASWLWVIALGGLVLWIARYRKGRGKLRLATIDRTARGRNRTLNWHGAMGVWLIVGLVFLSATGLTWSRFAGENVSELRTTLHWTTPAVDTDLTGTAPDGSGDHAGHGGHSTTAGDATAAPAMPAAEQAAQLDEVLAIARDAGVTDKVEIAVPADAQTTYKVTETREAWQLSPNSVAVDAADSRVVDTSWFADWPLAAKLTNWGIALHMGLLFGLLSQFLLLLLAVGLVAVIMRGYQMWWQRRPRDGSRRVGRAPVRGALWSLPPATAVGVVLVAVAVGWFVPLLGISLAAFLLVDVVIGVIGRMRTARQ
ncbi:PepSY domain-containing protein [Gordonia sp. HNM0687]|uniref:PepSY domain-containing protein n=1 Tax=Gordonia mangrovi TaxID=2665643 RepID=A0A6L7GTV0_9ACTN|nr:PepSY domain-containing protein [Gordonia mangrovi]MXP22993.1 PepSY domain-containing protein [Gordonia mangrovi]UVF77286.1 PepSY domain-containing protein [Gordonia mangrovi]